MNFRTKRGSGRGQVVFWTKRGRGRGGGEFWRKDGIESEHEV